MTDKLIVYLNGKLVPFEEARVSAFDRGLYYGYGFFETMRALDGRGFRLVRHWERLKRSARMMGLEEALAAFNVAQAVYDTLEANALANARIRITVTGGVGERALAPPTQGGITLLVLAEPFPGVPAAVYRDGIALATVAYRRDSHSILARIKATSMLVNMLASDEARAKGADEALLLNDKGFLAEGSSSNVFLVKGGQLLTPSIESGILEGITRETVLELAGMLGIGVVAGDIMFDDLLTAEEAFITAAVRYVVPVVRVDGHPVGPGMPGPVTGRIMQAFADLVELETGSRPW